MVFVEFLQRCHDSAIRFSLQGDQVKVNAPKDTLTPEVVAQLRQFKPELTAWLRENAGASQASMASVAPIARRAGEAAVRASYGQEQLWLTQQAGATGDEYHFVSVLDLQGPLSPAALEAALTSIVARHEPLRTVFDAQDGVLMQRILPSHACAVPLSDLTSLPPAEREEQAARLLRTLAAEPFDLARDLMLRVRLVRLGEQHHRLGMVMHHIASDGWSLGVLITEFQTLYASDAQAALPPLPVSYADYAHWLRETMQGQPGADLKRYWSERLRDVPQVHSLALDQRRPLEPTRRAGHLRTMLGAATLAALKQLAQQTGTTLFMVLETLFATVLRHHSQSDDMVIGTPVANRTHDDVAGLVGYFVNLVALRHQVDLELSFVQLLAQSRQHIVDAFRHQMLPFDEVVRAAVAGRSTSHGALVQVVFTLQNNAIGQLALPALACRVERPDKIHTFFDLNLEVTEADGRLALHWEYSSDLFTEARIARLAGQLEQLIAGVLTDRDLPLYRQAILGEAERQLLQGWNDTAADFPQDRCLHELFEAQVQRTPAHTALVYEDQALSYSELNECANRLAHCLREHGIGIDTPVGLCLTRGPDLIVALLAVLKAGGAYLPLDPGYPESRLAYMVADSGIRILLTETRLEALGASLAGAVPALRVVPIDGGQTAGQPTTNPARLQGQCARNLAYIIYTSGSTGQPKGVMVEHRGAANLAQFQRRDFAVQADSRVLAFASPSFDAAVSEWTMALLAGAALHLCTELQKQDPRALEDCLIAQRITHVTLPPALLPALDARREYALEHLILAGEAFSLSLLAGWQDRCTVHNAYGPTETTVCATTAVLRAGDAMSIGRPIDNFKLYVLDAFQALAPIGAIGELYIGGAGLARGYLNRPELTTERFVANPFAADPAEHLYRTGDLVRYLADGRLEYVGRIDDQVKIRGFRIELGEIEEQLARHPQVTGAVVLAREDVPGQKRLVAYLTANETDGLVAPLRSHLLAALPDYMVPALFVVMDALPVSANGKIDKKALPAPDAAALQAHYQAPRGATEQRLAEIWAALLQLPAHQVSAGANFFELGGHSLLAMRLLSEMRQAFGVELSVKDIFSTTSLAALAELADASKGRIARAPVTPHKRSANRLPASFAQQRLWFIDQFDAGSAHYNMPAALRVRGRFHASIAEQAFRRIIARHEPLRTVFSQDADGTWQTVRDQVDFTLARLDLGHVSLAEQERAVQSAAQQDASTVFSLAEDVMLRASYLRLADDDGVLLFNMHHIASDGWSMGVLIKEFITLYDALRAGRPDPLAPLALHYADYAQWQRDWLQGAVLEQQLAYWEGQLAGLPPVHSLPLDRPRPARQSFRGASHRFGTDRSTQAGLRQLARAQHATLFMVLHSAFAVLIARHAGSDDIVIGTPVANRLQKELEGLIGFFVNTLVLRSDCGGNPAFTEHLARTRAVNLDAQANQDVPFEVLVERLKPARSAQHSPLFQVMFSMNTNEGGDAGSLQLADVRFEPVNGTALPAKFELVLNASEGEDGLALSLDYNCDVFDAATIERMGEHFSRLLRAIVANPATPIRHLPMLSEAEQHHLLHSLNATAADYPRSACIHELFEAQAARAPDQHAVVYSSTTFSYAELNARANRLAHHLRAQGVGAGILVGLCVERTPDMLVGLLAVLKAGGAYVPLDPSYPPQRLAYMVADSAITILVTQAALADRLAPLTTDAPALRLIALDQAPLQGYPSTNRARDHADSSRNPAYVIYTSGSTGQPKGVVVEHASVINLWQALDAVLSRHCPAPTRVGLNGSLSFDGSMKSVVQLLSGHAIVIIPDDIRRDSAALLGYLEQHTVDAFDCTPAHLDLLISAGMLDATGYQPRLVLVGGEAISHASWRLMSASAIHFYNVYGPTECTVDSTIAPVRGTDHPHIGRPIPNAIVYVLDGERQLVPMGSPGELYIGGAGLARGYLHRRALTAERFIANPFSSDPADRLYRTGDLVRYLADGNLDYIGRIDDQVKLRGYRIELGEIAHQLARHPSVENAVVLVREDTAGDKRLVAYVTAAPNATPAEDDLRAHLQAALPDFMVPSVYVTMDQFPLTSNGKIDKRTLPAPDASLLAASYAAPQTETEATLAAIWATVLKLDQVGTTNNFFSLGGHSLLAVQLQGRVNSVFQKELKLKDVFDYPTVALMAARLDTLALSVAKPVTRLAEKAYYHTSFKQQAEWVHSQINTAVNNSPWCYQYRAPIPYYNLALLEQAMTAFIARHETLRTTFHVVDGVLCQKVHPPAAYSAAADLVDLSGLEDPGPALDAIERVDKARNFDFSTLYPFRLKLVTARTGHWMIFTIDHAFADRQFVASMQAEFGLLYQALLKNETPDLPAIDVTYKDYAEWEFEELYGQRGAEHRVYWHDLIGPGPYPTLTRQIADHQLPLIYSYADYISDNLAQLPAVLDPFLHSRVYGSVLGVENSDAIPRMTKRYAFPIRGATYAALQALSVATSTPVSALMLSALSIVLHRMSQARQVIVITLSGTRVSEQWAQVGGHMANEILSVTDFSDGMTVEELIRATRQQMLDSDEHKIYPLAKLLHELDVSHDGLGAARFNFISGFSDDELTHTAGYHEDRDAFGFELEVAMHGYANGIHIICDYRSDLFEPSTIESMMASLLRIARMIAQGEGGRIDTLALDDTIDMSDLRDLGAAGAAQAAKPLLASS